MSGGRETGLGERGMEIVKGSGGGVRDSERDERDTNGMRRRGAVR